MITFPPKWQTISFDEAKIRIVKEICERQKLLHYLLIIIIRATKNMLHEYGFMCSIKIQICDLK